MLLRKSTSAWFLAILFPLIYTANFLTSWPVVRLSGVSGELLFGDFSWLSRWSQECQLDVSFGLLPTIFSQLENHETCPGYNYGIFLLVLLSIFPINWGAYVALAFALGVVSLAMLGFYMGQIAELRRSDLAFLLLAVFSPGVFLLLERGNLDILIFCLVLISALLMHRGHPHASFLVVLFVTLLKLYTLPILILLAILAKSRVQSWLMGVLSGAVSFLVILDLSKGQTLPVEGFVQFGFPVLNHYFDWFGISIAPVPSILGLSIPLIVWYFLAVRQRNTQMIPIGQEVKALENDYVFLFFGITFVALFFVGLNYDYRLIFLVIAGVSLVLRGSWGSWQRWALWSLLLVALWGSSVLGNGSTFFSDQLRHVFVGGLQLMGDLATFVWVGILLHFGSLVVAKKLPWFGKILSVLYGNSKSRVGTRKQSLNLS